MLKPEKCEECGQVLTPDKDVNSGMELAICEQCDTIYALVNNDWKKLRRG